MISGCHYYYSSFSYVIAAFSDTSKSQTDTYLDKAVELADNGRFT